MQVRIDQNDVRAFEITLRIFPADFRFDQVLRTLLDRWPGAATRVPKTQHFDLATTHTIVEMVVNSGEMQASQVLRPGVRDWWTNAGLDAQKGKGLSKLLVKGFWRKRPVLVPPQGGAVNLRLRSLCDPDFHDLLSRDDAQVSQVPLWRIPFPHDRPRQWKEAVQPPPQGLG